MSHRRVTVLENLPVELFRLLFDYFDAYEIHYSFGKINSRLDIIIQQTTNLHINLMEIKSNSKYEFYMKEILPVIAPEHAQALKIPMQHLDELITQYPLSKFVNLRLLRLGSLKMNSVINQFPFEIIQKGR